MTDESTGAIPFCFTHGTDWEPGCQACEAAQSVSAMSAEHRARYPRCREWPLCGCGSKATWYDAAYERRYTAYADRLVHLDAYDAGALVVDLWEDPEHPRQVQVVVSVKRGVSAATAEPFIPEWAALAWETEPEADPRARLMEALLQGHLRAQERLTR